jgi:hypothetical protein
MMKIRSRVRAAILCLMLAGYTLSGIPANAGTLLPNGEQLFTDNNGLPLSAGCIFYYIPGTASPKTTYQNASQTVANTNPVLLDSAGRAIIYGTGTYRQVVQQAPCNPGSGTQIWDQLTADTSSSVTIYAGASSGTPNSIIVTAPAFSGTDGQVINYISTNTNSGGATINPSGFGAVQIVRDSATGPGALTGGELVATNAVSLIYDATAGTFHILSPVTWPNTSGVPVGATIAISGFTAPTNYAFAYGQAVSRTSFSSLFSVFTSAQTGTLNNLSPIITGLSDTTQFAKGQAVEAVGINAGTTLLSCTSTTCTMSANSTATRSGTITVFAYGDGDGSTTFNLPDYRGRGLSGRDNMGGTAANVVQIAANLSTTSSSPTATVSSATNLALGMSIVGNVNVPAGTTISAISGTTLTMSQNASASQSTVATRFSVFPDAQGLGIAGGFMVGTLTAANLPPYTPNGAINNLTFVLYNSQNAGGTTVPNAVAAANNNNTLIGGVNLSPSNASWTGTPAPGQTSVPASIIPPVANVNWAVRLTP